MLVGFPGGSVVENQPLNAGDMGSIPGSGRSPGEGNGHPLQDSCLGDPMDFPVGGSLAWPPVNCVSQPGQNPAL